MLMGNKTMLRTASIAVLLACGLADFSDMSAKADDQCKMYARNDANVPSDIASFLKNIPTGSMRVCVQMPSTKDTRYDVFSEVWRGNSGVCYVRSKQVFMEKFHGKTSWTYHHPAAAAANESQLYMSPQNRKCPNANDHSFVLSSGLSEGVFSHLMDDWLQISRNRKDFYAAISNLPSSIKNSPQFSAFEAKLFSAANETRISIREIQYFEPLPEFSVAKPTINPFPRYLMRVAAESDPSTIYEIPVDLTEGELKIFGFHVVVN